MKKRVESDKGACPDRREAILDVASSLFAKHGFADSDTQQLIDALHVGKGTLYRHFSSKRELFLAAADRVMVRLHEQVEQSIRDVEDPLERISLGIRTFLAFFSEHPEYVELLIQERAQFKDRDKPTFLEHRERTVERWRALYRLLIADGRVRPLAAERISDVFAAAMYGAMFLNYSSGRSGAFVAEAEDILDIFFFGILTDRERRRLRAGRDARPPKARARGGKAKVGQRDRAALSGAGEGGGGS